MPAVTNYKDFLERLCLEEKKVAPHDLFHEGNFSLLTTGVRVSVVGSRKVSEQGRQRTARITEALVKRNITVVSGLAEGVDTVAHETAITFKGRTIAVLGTPLDKCTPVSNKQLLDTIKKNHLAVSQFPVGSPVYNSNFPKRNKTMALISDATIIIEASEKSGTRHQAWEAIRLARPVFLLENLLKDPSLTWPNELMKYGAIVLTSKNFENILDGVADFSYADNEGGFHH